jgi:hypothetical protein
MPPCMGLLTPSPSSGILNINVVLWIVWGKNEYPNVLRVFDIYCERGPSVAGSGGTESQGPKAKRSDLLTPSPCKQTILPHPLFSLHKRKPLRTIDTDTGNFHNKLQILFSNVINDHPRRW